MSLPSCGVVYANFFFFYRSLLQSEFWLQSVGAKPSFSKYVCNMGNGSGTLSKVQSVKIMYTIGSLYSA